MPHPPAPEFWAKGREDEHRRKIAQVANGVLNGQVNNSLTVSLRASQTTTEIIDNRITPTTGAVLVPLSASAAAGLASIWVAPTVGKLTLNHDSNVATDRTYRVFLFVAG